MAWLALAGMGAQGYSQIQGARARSVAKKKQAAIYKYNAQLFRDRAKHTKRQTQLILQRAAERADRTQKDLENAIGTTQNVSGEGSNFLAKALQFTQYILEQFTTASGGRTAMNEAYSQALAQELAAKAAMKGAGAAGVAGFTGAGSTLLSGFASMNKKENNGGGKGELGSKSNPFTDFG